MRIGDKYQVVAYVFGQDAVAASQTDVQLNTSISEASEVNDGYTTCWDGYIIGTAFNLSAAGTAGVFTIGATVNGTEDADTTITVGTDPHNYKRVSRGAAAFVAGDRIGCEITTNGSWDGTSADLIAVVYTLQKLEGI